MLKIANNALLFLTVITGHYELAWHQAERLFLYLSVPLCNVSILLTPEIHQRSVHGYLGWVLEGDQLPA